MECKKQVVLRLDMQQAHCLHCNWTENGHMFLHQGTYVLINSTDAVTDKPNLET